VKLKLVGVASSAHETGSSKTKRRRTIPKLEMSTSNARTGDASNLYATVERRELPGNEHFKLDNRRWL
jgi:hypothetical protein